MRHMAKPKDTNMEYVSRASSFTYCGKTVVYGIEVPMTEESRSKYPTYPGTLRQFISNNLKCSYTEYGPHWSVMCEDCGRANGLIW